MQSVSGVLEELVDSGVFASTLQTHLNRHLRDNSVSFYGSALASKGPKSAEKQLDDWVRMGHRDIIAHSLEPVALGLLALSKADPRYLVDVTASDKSNQALLARESGLLYSGFVFFNDAQLDCNCLHQDEGRIVFGTGGELDLLAITLRTYSWRPAQLELAFPTWGAGSHAPKQGDIAIVTLDSDGVSTGEVHRPYSQTPEGEVPFARSASYLRRRLGLTPQGMVRADVEVGCTVDRAIGFPGSRDRLARELPNLGDYLSTLAGKLSIPHDH